MYNKEPSISKKSKEVLENELWRLLVKLEHRVEIFMAISHHQQANGHHELAEANKHQAMESKKHAESIRKLLIGQT